MTLFGPPESQNPIFRFVLKLIHNVFGQVNWQAPEWIGWTGRQLRSAVHYMSADRKRLMIAAIPALVAAAAMSWFTLRPRPHYVEYTVAAPKLTEYDEKGISAIYPLVVSFGEPAAPLSSLDKRLSAGIEISPAIAGKWTWLDDKRLQFTSSSDWPVDASFTVRIARRGFLAKTVELEDYSFKFRTQPFSAKITNSQFYQDPQNPTMKNLVATVGFSHPVDTTQFEQYVSLIPAREADFLGLMSSVI
jgi:alpha-2-macroglobulin